MIYFKIYIITYLLFSAYGQQPIKASAWDNLPKDCGKTRYDAHKARIIDGDRAKLGQFPWMARIGIKENNTINFFCGGSLVNRYYVVSAAHCEGDGDIVRLGENHVETAIDCDESGDCAPPHQDIKIKKYKFLDFDHEIRINDLSLIELESPVEFNEFVQPICLSAAPIPHETLINKYAFVAGWGYVNTKDFAFATHLMFVTLPVVDSKECNVIYPRPLESSQLCIGFSEGGKDSCGGDSGGPATMSLKLDGERKNYMVAVVSYGMTMCGMSVAVYTDVSYFVDWILENIKKS